ncbi:helix-turn-helix domain-containing protein [Holdemania massiliensis]|uniref:helix-turn-helix domain-containing protein n=1 Tax=Holdemania massiliensis TaxID=1468449 RepID=UPI0026764230|nr:helix-turn-helix transcriptional regulator [Holdemania massiliensis]
MLTSERIKQRRRDLRMSIDDLAEAIGKNRTTVYRYESGDIENLPLSVIEPLAKALRTTPEYLMGWDDNAQPVNNEKLNSFTLNDKEIIDLCLKTKPKESLTFFRNLIRNERIEQNLTERDLSTKASVPLEDYLSFEMNRKDISSTEIITLLDALGFDVSDIAIRISAKFTVDENVAFNNFLNLSGFPKEAIKLLSMVREIRNDKEALEEILETIEKKLNLDESAKQEMNALDIKINKALNEK